IRRSPLTDLLEIEALRVAVLAKTTGWEVLREVSAREPRLSRDKVSDLLDRAHDQRERVAALHLEVGRRTLG
ncbi:MAG: hypothetical protein M3Q17_05685, partial [Actinomycetota bacterium]|nr:hypothetical protein [Actinomycetota bacterium]